MTETLLDGNRLVATIETLCLRIEDRFPQAGLLATARALLELARESDWTIRWIERPQWQKIMILRTQPGAAVPG